jgi:hypothetical protein
MTDLVTVALITAIPGTIAAVLGVFNRVKLAAVGEQVDGNLSEVKKELAELHISYLALTKESSHAAGVTEGEHK